MIFPRFVIFYCPPLGSCFILVGTLKITINKIKMKYKAILLCLLLVGALSLTTITNNYPSTVIGVITFGASFAADPIYPVSIASGQSVTVSLHFPHPFQEITSLADATVELVDALGTTVHNTIGFTGTARQQTLTVVAGGAVSYIKVTPTTPPVASVEIYQLQVVVNGVARVRVVDMLRSEPRLYYYLDREYTKIDLVIAGQTTSVSGNQIPVVNQALIGRFLAGAADAKMITCASGPGDPGHKVHPQTFPTTGTLLKGFYYIKAGWIPNDLYANFTYGTDPYACPYDGAYFDYYGTFKGCSFSTHQDFVIRAHQCGARQFYNGTCNNVDPSCGAFDPFSGNCLTCQNGSPAVRGSCSPSALSTSGPVCPSGKRLFNNAICIPEECSAANADGSCSSCISSAFVLSGGSCIPVNCGTGSFFSVVLNQCALLPDKCLSVSPLTQLCTICIAGFNPDSTGTCVSPCPSGQFYVKNDGNLGVQSGCYALPVNCKSLDSVLHCTSCVTNYEMVQGDCQLCNGPNPSFPCVRCPIGQFVNNNGSCITQGQNCASIDQNSGLCLSCANGDTPVIGVCCISGETVLANGRCGVSNGSGASGSSAVDFNTYHRHCQTFSPPLGKCIECRNGRSFIGNSDRCQ